MTRSADAWGIDSKGRMRMRITVPIPPSDNHLYEEHIVKYQRGGRWMQMAKKRLSEEGRAYHQHVRDAIAELAATSSEEFQRDVMFTCSIRVYFPAVENKGWPGKAKNRYKIIDTMNRAKLVTDIASTVIGVDDSHHFVTTVRKKRDRNDPRLELTIRERWPRDG